MSNSTNSTVPDLSVLEGQGTKNYAVFGNAIVRLCIITLSLVLNGLVIFLVIREKSLHKTIRLVLISILLSCIVIAAGGIVFDVVDAVFTFDPLRDPDPGICHFAVWLVLGGGACRLGFMALFSIVVFILVRYGDTRLRMPFLVLSIAVIWITVAAYSSVLFSPQVVLVNSLVGFKCSVHVQDSVGGYLFTAIYILVFGVVVYAITIGFPIRALFYIRKNNITGDKGSQKALVRFSLFLLIGNTISFIGHVVPIIASAAPESKNMQESEIIFGIVEGYFVYVSLLITPVLIVLYFRKIRSKVFSIATRCCRECQHVEAERNSGAKTTASGMTVDSS